jgi:hypothetical protein
MAIVEGINEELLSCIEKFEGEKNFDFYEPLPKYLYSEARCDK